MQFEVIRLFNMGTKLPPGGRVKLLGELTIHERSAEMSIHKRMIRVARVRGYRGMNDKPDLCGPLFDVCLQLVTAEGMLLIGNENEIVDGQAVSFGQSWWCRWPAGASTDLASDTAPGWTVPTPPPFRNI